MDFDRSSERRITSVDAALYPSAGSILFRTMWHYLPDWVLDILKRSPNRMLKRAGETSRLFREVAGRLLKEKESEMNAKAEDGHKDVLSILGMFRLFSSR